MEQDRVPLRITFRNFESSPALEAKVREGADRLADFCDRIVGCHVMVEAQHRHHRKGRSYNVRIDLKVPGAEIAVSRDPEADHAHDDAYVSIGDAFAVAGRRLQDHLRRGQNGSRIREEPS